MAHMHGCMHACISKREDSSTRRFRQAAGSLSAFLLLLLLFLLLLLLAVKREPQLVKKLPDRLSAPLRELTPLWSTTRHPGTRTHDVGRYVGTQTYVNVNVHTARERTKAASRESRISTTCERASLREGSFSLSLFLPLFFLESKKEIC